MTNEKAPAPHSIILEDRKKLILSGVKDVDSFDGDLITAYTSLGELVIKGSMLKVLNLNTETGELNVEGQIASMTYTQGQSEKGSLLSRLFR